MVRWHMLRGVRRDQRGASAVEFALVVIPLLWIVFGIISFGMMLSFRQTLSQSTAEGARAAAVEQNPANRASSATTAISSALGAMKLGGVRPSCTDGTTTCTVACQDQGGGTVACTAATAYAVKVTVTYPYRAHPAIPSLPLVGSMMPRSLTYSATVRVS